MFEAAPRSRRAILLGALGAVGATMASALGRPATVRAGVDGDVVLGAANTASATTSIANPTNANTVLSVQNSQFGATAASAVGHLRGLYANGQEAIVAEGSYGIKATGAFEGVVGSALGNGHIGVHGWSDDGIGVRAQSEGGPAVLATSDTSTAVDASTDSGTAIVAQSASGAAVLASSASQTEPGAQGSSFATGIRGLSTSDEPTSDFDVESHHTGVVGIAGGDDSLLPTNTDETGVYGFAGLSELSTGVWGDSINGYGVYGTGEVGTAGVGFIGVQGIPSGANSTGVFANAGSGETGVYGFVGTSTPPAPPVNVAVHARAGSTSQVALDVAGKVRFSRSGKATVAAGAKSKTVTMAGVTTSSYIIATPQTNRAGVFVQSVVPAAGSFKINLNKTVTGATVIGYLVIN